MAGALHGIRVLDLSRILAGPWASQLLADLGAEVIKVERPGIGDDTRSWTPPALADGLAAYFICANRGKKSLAIDISLPEGQAIIRQLVQDVDVVLENYKLGGMAKYGLDYASLSQLNPRLIYCSITGFGQTGPYAAHPGYDYIIQGMSGLMSITGPADGEPHKVGVAVTDVVTGLYAANAIMAALLSRKQTGEGQYIDMALLDCALAMQANVNMNWLVGHEVPPRLGNAHPNIVPYQVFACQDGFFILACGNDRQFAAVAELLAQVEWAQDARFATNAERVKHRDVLVPLLAAEFKKKNRDEWLSELERIGVPCGPINTIAEAFDDPQVKSRGLEVHRQNTNGEDVPMVACPIRLSKTPVEYRLTPPALGEHTEQILIDLGYDAHARAQLKQQGVI